MRFKNKKGVSVLVGYILLVVFVIIISVVVYNWLKSYVPSETMDCPEGVSISIKEYAQNCDDYWLNLTLKNSGRFNVAGFFIHVSNKTEQEVATIDMTEHFYESVGDLTKLGNSLIYLSTQSNNIKPGDEVEAVFKFPSDLVRFYSITLTPTRFQEENNKERFVSCANSKITQSLECGDFTECISDCTGRDCGPDPVCGVSCGTCTSPEVCDSTGQCVPEGECTDDCGTFGYNCGIWEICGVDTDCGECDNGYVCNEITGQCEETDCDEDGDCEEWEGCSCVDCEGYQATQCLEGQTCKDGVCIICDLDNLCETSAGEDCSCFDCEGKKDGCADGEHCKDGACDIGIPPLVLDCSDFCVYYGEYIDGECRQAEAQCGHHGEVYVFEGEDFCAGDPLNDFCCCEPFP